MFYKIYNVFDFVEYFTYSDSQNRCSSWWPVFPFPHFCILYNFFIEFLPLFSTHELFNVHLDFTAPTINQAKLYMQREWHLP